jgi:hypothetical protein
MAPYSLKCPYAIKRNLLYSTLSFFIGPAEAANQSEFADYARNAEKTARIGKPKCDF